MTSARRCQTLYRFHVMAMGQEAMKEVWRAEMRERPQAVHEAVKPNSPKVLRNLLWGMRKNPANWDQKQLNAMHWLQRSTLQSARAWRLKMAVPSVGLSAPS